MAELGWIDFSSDHRAKVASVIDLVKPEGRVDELGIGIIRNALSDAIFPGISTIQKRAKYFLIVPRIIKDYQTRFENKKSRPKLRDYLRNRENHYIRILADKYQNSDENGVIGITLAGKSKKQELVRKPSSIYWSGLCSYKIVDTSLSLAEYQDRNDRNEVTTLDLLQAIDEKKGDDRDAGYEDNFRINLPDNNENWDRDLSIGLQFSEASFLKDKIIDNHKNWFLGQMLCNKKHVKDFALVQSFRDMCDLFLEKDIPSDTKKYLKLASDFDEIIHGAHIRYNCQLQERFGTDEKLREFDNEWEKWLADLKSSPSVLDDFNEDDLLNHATTVRDFTRDFVTNWSIGLREGKNVSFFDNEVIKQEGYNKGGKARLRIGAEENADGWVGIRGLSYRFPVAKTIVTDIKDGLGW